MKRKELYDYIREEIINELSLAEGGTVNIIATSGNEEEQSVQNDPKIKQKPDVIKALKNAAPGQVVRASTNESELEEMARKAGGYKIGDTTKFAEAKDLYNAGLYADLLNAIEEAGDDGISQKELGAKLGKGDGSSLNAILNKFKAIGVLGGGKLAAAEKPEKPEVGEPEGEEPEDEFASLYASDEEEEEETPEKEETPTAVDDKELEKVVGKSSIDLTPEEQKLFDTYKTAISNKVKVLNDKKASAEDKSKAQAAISNYKAKDDVKAVFKKKGLSLIDYINSELNK
jgi:hypothetical protein